MWFNPPSLDHFISEIIDFYRIFWWRWNASWDGAVTWDGGTTRPGPKNPPKEERIFFQQRCETKGYEEQQDMRIYGGFLKQGYPQSSILIVFSIVNQSFWVPPFMEILIWRFHNKGGRRERWKHMETNKSHQLESEKPWTHEDVADDAS